MKATDVIQPTPIKYPIAYDGIKNSIPLAPTGSNLASITEGFPEITMKSLAEGGKPPKGQDFNGLFYMISDQKAFFQDGGYITFDTTVSTLIGGYPSGAILDYYNPSTNYYTKVESLIDDNTYDFVTTPSYIDDTKWRYVDFGTGANEDLSNLSVYGNARLHALKGYEDTGELLTDAEGLADVKYYAHSTFDLSKFTVVGSPIVTSDGIASGFSSSNKIYIPISGISSSSNINIYTFVKTGNTVTSNGICYLRETSQIDFCLDISSQSKLVLRYWNGSTLIVKTSDYTISANTDYLFKINYNNGTVSVYANGVFVDSVTGVSITNPNALYIGESNLSGGSYEYFTGSIDLKQLSTTVDSIPAFSGNKTGIDTYTIGGASVSIPYALSKTGSKIVDSTYRTQVTTVYNYQGYAPYYTLDEINGNFTLPMGEIYGMMLNQSTPHIVDVGGSGNKWYIIYSNGWCIQGDAEDISSTYSATEKTRTLNIPFKDNTYTVLVALNTSAGDLSSVYTAVKEKAVDSFKTGATCTCSWVAFGWVN